MFIAFKYRSLKNFVVFCTILLFIVGCHSTKYVPTDKYLLNSVKFKIQAKNIKKDDVYGLLRQKPNKRILGLKFHLGLYNLSNLKKEKGINKYLRNIGEEPVILDPNLTSRSVDQIKLYMVKRGYYNCVVTDTTKYHKKKAKIIFTITANQPYLINNFTYNIEDTLIRRFVYEDSVNTLIKRGRILDADVIKNERARIEFMLKDHGFYSFSRNDIPDWDADSLNHKVNIEIIIKGAKEQLENNQMIRKPYKIYKIRDVLITTENNSSFLSVQDGKAIQKDTIVSNGIKFIYQENFWVKPDVILQSCYVSPGTNYSQSETENTKRYLTSLNVFSVINIQYNELPDSDTSEFRYLDCSIQLTPSSIQSYDLGIEGTNSSGNFGGGVNLSYLHKSLFGNADAFQLKLHGSIESIVNQNTSTINKTVEYGADATIHFPKLLLPINNIKFIKKYNPKTLVSLAYSYQKRPDFTRAMSNLSFGYSWQQGKYINHKFNLLEMNLVYLSKESSSFRDSIRGTYLEYSYTNHLVPVTSYTWQYSNQNIKKTRDFIFARISLESAGNIISFVNKTIGSKKYADSISGVKVYDYYKLFGIRYSQYLKLDIDYRYYQVLNSGSMMVYRIFAGIAYPYGNAIATPFEKLYFSGGANSIRGWMARTIGPGSYKNQRTIYPNSTGDIKLEANIEYRFKLFWVLEGALFTDIGNVWAIRGSDEREGALFKFNKFYSDLAIGSGLGMRFDFKFFLFRTDLGLKVRNPALDPGKKWIFSQNKVLASDMAFNIAIAYPF